MSQSRTVLSAPALASVCPSGLNATSRTLPVCPVRVATGARRSRLHSRTVLPLAVAMVRPSGLNAGA